MIVPAVTAATEFLALNQPAAPADARTIAELRHALGLHHAERRAGLLDPGHGDLQVVVVGDGLGDQRLQRRDR